MAMTIASDMEMKPIWKAFSVSVRVSAREFLNIRSTAAETSAARSGLLTPMTKNPTWSARRGTFFFIVSLR